MIVIVRQVVFSSTRELRDLMFSCITYSVTDTIKSLRMIGGADLSVSLLFLLFHSINVIATVLLSQARKNRTCNICSCSTDEYET